MFQLDAIFLSALTVSVLAVTGIIAAFNVKRPTIRLFGVVVALPFGSFAFVLAYVFAGLLAHLSIHGAFIDALMEESFKVVAIVFAIRWAKPVSVTAYFGAIEVVTKYYFLFLVASSFRTMVVEAHLAYVVLGIMGAYGMHVATGVFYGKIGIRSGFAASFGAHFTYNALAYKLDNYGGALDGLMLLVVSGLLVGAAQYSGDLLSRFDNSDRPNPASS